MPEAAASVAPMCSLENHAFVAGERIKYELYYNLNFIWLPAGTVEFTVEDRGSQYKLTAIGKSYPSYGWFFEVDDRYTSYIDKGTLLPELTLREVNEGKYHLFERVEYDLAARTGIAYRGHTKEEAMARPVSFEMEDCLHDVLSAIYFTRNFGLDTTSTGTEFPLTIFMDQEKYPLGMRLLGREHDKKIKGLGRYDVYELAPQVIAGDVFSEESEMRVWTSVANSHVPLQIESPLSVGSVKAVLQEHENLLYDIAAN